MDLHGIFTKSNVSVNGRVCGENGMSVHTGDVIGIGRKKVVFEDIPASKRAELDSRREAAGYAIGPGLTLLGLTVFQAFLMLEQTANAAPENIRSIALGYSALALLEWFCYAIMRSVGRTGFEVETLAFFLSTIGLSVVASSAPEDILKEILLLIAGIALFFLLGWWLRDLERTKKYRFAVAALSLILLVLNLALSTVTNGARNWIEIGGFSIQPSELIKVAYIYVGAATLDRLFSTKNLIRYIIFSAICVMGLAIMGDFGTALIFFATFLVISYMRSGSIATVALALTGAGMAGFMVLSIRPYVAQRFANWGHVWEDVYGTGYQQTRTMSAAAAGGLFGKGAGNGWLKDIFAANTDMVFGVICEELGLLIALLAILAVLVLAFFAVRSAAHGRSSYYVIAACATGSMLLIQLSLTFSVLWIFCPLPASPSLLCPRVEHLSSPAGCCSPSLRLPIRGEALALLFDRLPADPTVMRKEARKRHEKSHKKSCRGSSGRRPSYFRMLRIYIPLSERRCFLGRLFRKRKHYEHQYPYRSKRNRTGYNFLRGNFLCRQQYHARGVLSASWRWHG